jgi:hypothetical protein
MARGTLVLVGPRTGDASTAPGCRLCHWMCVHFRFVCVPLRVRRGSSTARSQCEAVTAHPSNVAVSKTKTVGRDRHAASLSHGHQGSIEPVWLVRGVCVGAPAIAPFLWYTCPSLVCNFLHVGSQQRYGTIAQIVKSRLGKEDSDGTLVVVCVGAVVLAFGLVGHVLAAACLITPPSPM